MKKKSPFADIVSTLLTDWLHQTGFVVGMIFRARAAEVALESPTLAPFVFGVSEGMGAFPRDVISLEHVGRDDSNAMKN